MNALETALNKLAKWRSVFAGWQLGTRTKDDPESQAVRDHRENTIMLRAEINALISVLTEKRVISHREFQAHLLKEANWLDEMYQRKFPGFQAVNDGISIDPIIAANTTRNWRP